MRSKDKRDLLWSARRLRPRVCGPLRRRQRPHDTRNTDDTNTPQGSSKMEAQAPLPPHFHPQCDLHPSSTQSNGHSPWNVQQPLVCVSLHPRLGPKTSQPTFFPPQTSFRLHRWSGHAASRCWFRNGYSGKYRDNYAAIHLPYRERQTRRHQIVAHLPLLLPHRLHSRSFPLHNSLSFPASC